MRFSFKVAWRFLKSNKGQTILIALGIAIGVSVQVFIGSLITGLQKSLINKTIGNSSQITLVSNKDDKTIEDWEAKIDTIKKADSRIKYISPSADASAFIKFGDKTEPILLRGVQLENANNIYNIKSRIYEGKQPVNDNEALIGRELSKNLDIKTGDKFEVITPKGNSAELIVTGIYDLKVSNINKSWIITNLKTSQSIFSFNNKITSIEMKLEDKNIFRTDVIAENISSKLSDGSVKLENWKSQNEELLSGLKGQRSSSIMIQVFVLIAVVLGIASVLAITVLQKSKQIGILKAMGVKDRVASLIFLSEGFILGVIGAVLGVGLGLGLSFSFTKFALNADGTPVVPLYVDYKFITLSAFIALASATFAALIPARRSSKLNPIEVIKNG